VVTVTRGEWRGTVSQRERVGLGGVPAGEEVSTWWRGAASDAMGLVGLSVNRERVAVVV